MKNKKLLKSSHGVLKSGVIILALLCMGCGGGSSSTPEEVEKVSLAYDSTYTSVTGTMNIKIADMVNNSHVQETVVLQGFSLTLGDCPINDFTIEPQSLTFTDETIQTLSVTLTTISPCFADSLILNAEKVVYRVQSGITLSPESSTIALGFSIPVEDGAEDTAGAYTIQFVSADPSLMALSGMGTSGQSENSLVSFMVKDKKGNPMAGEIVNFSLTTGVGGLSLANTSDVSDSEGIVLVNVLSGNVSTSVAVIATLADMSASAQSSQLSVNTGFPDQDSFSLSIDTLNPEGLDYDGETITFTIRAADHFNNPVPDGTAVYFSTEGGAIEPSCSTVKGTCSVVWTSQNPRPSNGRATVIATAIGGESFIDANGNGFYNHGELFTDLSEAFQDDNENGIFDLGFEEFFDFNANGIFDSGNGIYNGFLCSDTPHCTLEQVHVRKSAVIAMAGSSAMINISPTSVNLTTITSKDVTITVHDVNGNPMPKGTSVNFTTTNGEISGSTSFTVESSSKTNNSPDKNMLFTVSIQSDSTDSSGHLTVEVKTPNGETTTSSITVID